MRTDDYLIIRFQTGYTALHGPQCAREILGQGLETAEAAKAICDQHRQKKSRSALNGSGVKPAKSPEIAGRGNQDSISDFAGRLTQAGANESS